MRTDEDRQLAEEVESALRALGIVSVKDQHGAIAPAVSDLRGEETQAEPETLDGRDQADARTRPPRDRDGAGRADSEISGTGIFGVRHRSERHDTLTGPDEPERSTDWFQPSKSRHRE